MPDDKKNLKASEGIAGLFGMEKSEQYQTEDEVTQGVKANQESGASSGEKTAPAPVNLPTGQNGLPDELIPETAHDAETHDRAGFEEETDQLRAMPDLSRPSSSYSVGRLVKSILPYLAIFAIGIGLYFFYFSDFSFQSLFRDTLRLESLTATDRDKNIEQIKKDVERDYNIWIKQFFVDVNDPAIVSMDTDVSGNGLTNLEKYLLNLNPKIYSTQGGTGDGQLVISDINPWTGRSFTEKQKELVDRYIYKELISNRITAAAITRG
ncbi:MAG TPA: hypothetical protein PKD79_03500, partial [Candidatus Doudnabacteria bacterium]|nr:hypothetical protein [Candidatus Doudnabacteria bacterium]